jgi:hypothetical protein
MDLEVAGLEVGGGFDEVEEPGASAAVEDSGLVAHPELTEAVDPDVEGLLVFAIEGFDGNDVEAGGFGGSDFGGERLEDPIRIEGAQGGSGGGAGAGHAMEEDEAAGDEQVAHTGEAGGRGQ